MTDWNERYVSGDTPWEKGRAAPPLEELMERKGVAFWGDGGVLVPGCGAGHDVRALAGAGLEVTGLDLAEEALSKANEYERVGTEVYEQGDFLKAEWRAGREFSAIWEHTCFCAIDPGRRDDYARACADLITPGGHLLGVFFLTPQGPDSETEGPPFNASMDEIDDRLGAWFGRVDSWIPGRCYPGRERQEWTAIYKRK